MSASTNLLADAQTVITNGPNAATVALAIAQAGPIADYVGISKLVLLKLQEAKILLTAINSITASGDTANKALIVGVLAVLSGLGSPATTVLADLASVITTGPGATTIASASAQAGPIMDYLGNLKLALLKFQEVRLQCLLLVSITDASDSANKTLLQGIDLVLV